MKYKQFIPIIFSITGLLFWLIVAFPFENRNESFSWVAQIEQSTLWGSVSHTYSSVITYRPLSQLLAWILYYLGSGNIYLVQFLNFILLIISFIIIIKTIKEKYVVSLLLFISGFIFFSAFYYVFHLHGIFYSPLILLTACLLFYKEVLYKKNPALLMSFIITLLVTAIHTYAVIIYLMFLIGLLTERKGNFNFFQIGLLIATLIISLLIIFTNTSAPGKLGLFAAFENLKSSLYRVEVHGKLSPIIFLLSIVSVQWIENNKLRNLSLALIFIISTVLFLNSIPVFFLLIVLVFLKLVIKKKWTLFFVIITLITFPSIVQSGAPTKSALLIPFVIMIIAEGLIDIENRLHINGIYYILFVILFLFSSLLTRLNVSIPVLKNITRPIQQEREKTIQLSEILNWYIKSDYRGCSLILKDDLVPFNNKNFNNERRIIPPTNQYYLNDYVNVLNKKYNIQSKNCNLIICFGGQKIIGKQLIFEITSMHAGTARVYY